MSRMMAPLLLLLVGQGHPLESGWWVRSRHFRWGEAVAMVVLQLFFRAAVAANPDELVSFGSWNDISCGMYGELRELETLSQKNLPEVASAVMSQGVALYNDHKPRNCACLFSALLRHILFLNFSDSVPLKQMSMATLRSDQDLQSVESRLRAISLQSANSGENMSSTTNDVAVTVDGLERVERKASYFDDVADRSRAWLLRWGLESIARLDDIDGAARSITSPKHIGEVLEVGNALCQMNSNLSFSEIGILEEQSSGGLRVAACFFTFRGAARQIEVVVSLTRSPNMDINTSAANLTAALNGVDGAQPASAHVDLLRRVISDMAWNSSSNQDPTSSMNAHQGSIGRNTASPSGTPSLSVNQSNNYGGQSQGAMMTIIAAGSSGNINVKQQDQKGDKRDGQYPVSCVGPCERLPSKPNTRSLETALWLVSGVLSAVVFCTIASVIIHRVHRAARSRRRPPGLPDFSRPGFGTSARLGSASEEGFTDPFNPLHSNSAAAVEEPVRLEVESELGEASYGFAGTNTSPYSLGIPRGIWIGVSGFGSGSRGVRLVGNNSRVVAAVVQPDGLAALAYMQPKRVDHKRSHSGVSDVSSENEQSPKAS